MTRDRQTLLRPYLSTFRQYKQSALVFFLFIALLFLSESLRAQEVEVKIGSTNALTIKKNSEGDVLFQTSSNQGNLFMGYQAGLENGKDSTSANDGRSNTGFGNYALQNNTNGLSNTAMGIWSLTNNTTGSSNTAMGWSSLQFNVSGSQNTAFGISSLRANQTGIYNTAVGQNALGSNVGGNYNLGLGSRSGVFVTGGTYNVFLGSNAGAGGNVTSDAHTKSNNVMIGYNSGEQAQGSNNVFLGYESGQNETGDHKLYIENTSADSASALIYGEFDNDLIRLNGKVIMRDGYTDTDGDTKVEVEQSADDDKIRFTIEGVEAMRVEKNNSDYYKVQNSFNQWNTLFGYNAGNNIGVGADGTTLGVNEGKYNTAFGSSALRDLNIGVGNTAYGVSALANAESAVNNVAIGTFALQDLISGGNNTAIGDQALLSNTGSGNTAIGRGALNSSVAGSNSVAVGYRTGAFDTQAQRSVYIGYSAGAGGSVASDAHTKQNNVMIGYNAGQQAQGDGNVFLGYEAGKDEAGNNKLYIENSDATSTGALLYGEFDNDLLRVNGELNINNAYSLPSADGLADRVMTTDGAGNVTWDINHSAVWQLESGDDLVYEDGDVGVGIGNPIYRFEVLDNSSNYIARFRNSNTGNSDGLIVQAGAITNPTSSSYYMLFLDGNGTNIGSVRGNGAGGVTYNTTSDRRLKMNIEDYTAGLDLVNKIAPREYERKSLPGKKEIGFIAQELYEVYPQAVAGSPEDSIDEPMMVDYSNLTPVLVAAIKELSEKNEQLEKQILQMQFNQQNETEELKASLEVVLKRLDAVENAN